MIMRVRYENGAFDLVSSQSIDRLIEGRRIKKFYRPSERRWVDTTGGKVRKQSAGRYDGVERRGSGLGKLWSLIRFRQRPIYS